jgi:predicted AAA+ superfamily ATPase
VKRERIFSKLSQRLAEKRRFMQILIGPRQVGKTTLAKQVMAAHAHPTHYGSADDPAMKDRDWVFQQWDLARLKAKGGPGLLVLDEVQKIPDWSEAVKSLWDADSGTGSELRVLLLGSSPLLLQSGLSESLAGRFEVIAAPHWSFAEMHEAFGWDLDTYIFYGGYPGAADLIAEPERWHRYVNDSLIETSISRDILLMTRVDKPALLRRLFQLGCDYSGQILSYQKMLGQLLDAGNTVTLAHYLELLKGAGMVAGLQKFTHGKIRQRGSSPKLQVLNTALMSANSMMGFDETRANAERWGRMVESAVGAHLWNSFVGGNVEVTYWRERGVEVDFVIQRGSEIVALEVKSGAPRHARSGLQAFRNEFTPKAAFLIGSGGMPLEDFFLESPMRFFQSA